MNKRYISTVLVFLGFLGAGFFGSVGTVFAATTEPSQTVAALPPPGNQPLKKYVTTSRSGKVNASIYDGPDTPVRIYYNDGWYTGYLERGQSNYEHNFTTGTNRWVSAYAGYVRSVLGGSAVTYQIEVDK